MDFLQYFDHGIILEDYIQMTQKLVNQETTTGHNTSEEMVQYTKLNLHRTKRWLKKGDLPSHIKDVPADQFTEQKWLVISEPWCGDAAHNLPFMQLMADQFNIDLKIVLRDDNKELINEFLTRGGESIPKLIALDHNGQVLFDWGPRPLELQRWYYKAKGENTSYEKIFDYLQKFYNKDAGTKVVLEIFDLMK